jgi:hypothetical protein
MNVFPEQIERSGDQAQYSGKQKSRTNGLPGGESHDKHQGRNGEAATTDPGQPDSSRNKKPDEEVHLSARVEKV